MIGSSLQKKANKTPDEIAALNMLQNGGDYVSEENLNEVMAWFKESN
jgi:hypothetical protein